MNIQLLQDITKLFALTVGFYLLHFGILELGNFEKINLLGVYLFMFGLTALAYIIIRVVHENDREKTAFMFLGFSMVKMMAAIMYLSFQFISQWERQEKSLFCSFLWSIFYTFFWRPFLFLNCLIPSKLGLRKQY